MGEGSYTQRYTNATNTTKMTPALVIKVKAASAIVLSHWSWRNEVATGHSSWTTTFEEKGGRAEVDSNRHPFAYQPDALPLGQSGWLKEDDGIVQCCNWVDLHPHPHPTPAPQSPANVHPQLLNTLDRFCSVCGGCFIRQSICSVIPLESGMSSPVQYIHGSVQK